MPALFIVTGANGAGKSTLSKTLLPSEIADLDVFDGDKLFVEGLREIFPSHTKSPKLARQMAFERTVAHFEWLVTMHLAAQRPFAYEGHFSSEAPWEVITRFRDNGYSVTMAFLMVNDLSISQQRVVERVKTGGHYVTPLEVEKNFYGNIVQLDRHFELLDELIVIDNSTALNPTVILQMVSGKWIFTQTQLPPWFESNMPRLTSLVKG